MLQVFAPVPEPAGLVGWWRAENNAQDSAGTNHGVAQNGVGFAAGRVGQAFAFDGKDDFIEIPDAPSLRSISVTLEAWVAFDVTTGRQVIISKGTRHVLRHDSYALSLIVGSLEGQPGDPGFIIRVPFAPEPGSWHHLAYTFDNAKQQVLYIDGVQVATGRARPVLRRPATGSRLYNEKWRATLFPPRAHRRSLDLQSRSKRG